MGNDKKNIEKIKSLITFAGKLFSFLFINNDVFRKFMPSNINHFSPLSRYKWDKRISFFFFFFLFFDDILIIEGVSFAPTIPHAMTNES